MRPGLRKLLPILLSGKQATITAIGSAVSTTDAQQYNFTGWNLPAGRILIGIGTRDSAGVQTVSSVTVDGDAASSVVSVASGASNLNNTAVFEFENASALTNVTIQVNMSGAVDRCGIDVVVTNGTVSDSDTSTANDPTATLTVPVRGAVYAYVFGVGYVSVDSWTGATEHTDEIVETTVVHSAAAAEVPAGGETTVTADTNTNATAGIGGVFVAIAPP